MSGQNGQPLFLNSCKQFIPNRDIIVRPKDKPWVDRELKALLRRRNRLWRRWKRTGQEEHHSVYKLVRNEAVSLNRKKYAAFCNRIHVSLSVHHPSPKMFWSLTKVLMGSKVSTHIPPLYDGVIQVNSANQKAELLNSFFCSNCKSNFDLSDSGLPEFKYLTSERLQIFEFTVEETYNVLLSLDVNKSVGPDGISNRMLRDTAYSSSVSLTDIFNYSLKTGFFPSDWKKANVSPIFKKGNRSEVKNYQPISLLSNVSKVFERLVYNQLYTYIVEGNLLTSKNSGFKKKNSTITQLISLCHKIYKGLDDNKVVSMVFLDASKAFDRVWHKGLLFILKQLGICQSILNWFSSYLSGRSQRVIVDGCASSWAPVENGVPQGSILGPLLFLVYTNDIVDNIENDINLYADDTSLLSISDNPETAAMNLNADLFDLQHWAKTWHMAFNPAKTVYMSLSREHNHYPIYLDGNKLASVENHCHLGLTFSNNMKWSSHIQVIRKKVSQRLGILQSLKFALSRKSLEHIYLTMILPILDYGDIIYDN